MVLAVIMWTMVIFLIIGQLVPSAIAVEETDADEDPCRRVQGYKHKGVQAVGELTDSLVLITDDWYVFEVPREALRPDLGKFYLNSKPPMEASEKWPELWKNEQFQKIKTESKLAQSYVDSSHGQDDIRFETIEKKTHDPGVNFIVNKRLVDVGARLWNAHRPFITMGSGGDNTNYTYTFQRQDDGSIQISAWRWRGDKNHWWERDFNTGFPICAGDQPNEFYVRFQLDTDCDRNIDWPQAYHGFVGADDRKFYLFAESYVLIFDESVFDYSCAVQQCDGPSTSYRKINYNDFIQCQGVVASVSPRAIQAAPRIGWAIWLAIILALLLLLLCCLLLLAREAMARKKKSAKNIASASGNNLGYSRGNASITPRSVREALSSRFGMLTAVGTSKKPKSASAVNSPKTARSKMANSMFNKLSRKPSNGSPTSRKLVTARSGPVNRGLQSHTRKKSRNTTKTGFRAGTARSSVSHKFGKLSKNRKSSNVFSRKNIDPTGRSGL